MQLQPRILILIFIVISIIVLSLTLIDYTQSKKELTTLMVDQSHTILETALAASSNALLTFDEVYKSAKERLLNNANIIKMLYEKDLINDNTLNKIAEENDIYRINIYDKNGEKIYKSHQEVHTNLKHKTNPQEILKPIFDDIYDTLEIGIKESKIEGDYRFAMAVAAKNRSAIVVNIDAERFLELRKKLGFGVVLKKISQNPQIVYAILQDSIGIIAGAGKIPMLEPISDSEFLINSLKDSLFSWRITNFNDEEVFEAVHPFENNNNVIGIFRLGLSLEPINILNQGIISRLIISGLILLILGSLLITYIFTQQNFRILKKAYKVIEGYSNKVIQNVSDAVIVIDENNKVKIFNSAAQILFNLNEGEIIGKPLTNLFTLNELKYIINHNSNLIELEYNRHNSKEFLLISNTKFETSDNLTNQIFVIRNITEQKKTESWIRRKEKLIAMGELASGVAHEIRNPLNTIGTIAQQLNRDFLPTEGADEYKTLTSLVYNEVKRINQTVKSFLQFAKPDPIKAELFELDNVFNQIKKQYESLLTEKNITLSIKLSWHGTVYWDRNQILQVFINLIQNSIDALDQNGEIKITIDKYENENLEIKFIDNGPGIPEDILDNIFNLYFTTKASGTGIGLSIVQKIIFEHGGNIFVESEINKGTIFNIKLPIKIIDKKNE